MQTVSEGVPEQPGPGPVGPVGWRMGWQGMSRTGRGQFASGELRAFDSGRVRQVRRMRTWSGLANKNDVVPAHGRRGACAVLRAGARVDREKQRDSAMLRQ